jgi:hypothetical protein
LSEAIPPSVIELALVLYEEPDVGEVIVTLGGVSDLLSTATSFPFR